VRIDRKRLRRDRAEYYAGKLDEVFDMTGVRISLVAEIDGHVTGFMMARVDFGAYARPEPVAVLDTLDVDPAFERRGIGTALLAQLLINLTTLRVERIRTLVDASAYRLHAFFIRHGFAPSQELVFTRGS
jgi:predicted N-acetyltransferase YhbS